MSNATIMARPSKLECHRGFALPNGVGFGAVFAFRQGKIERGEHAPTLAVIFKIAGALECSTAVLMAEAESRLQAAEA
ncbi:helix-turn-helix domain-containing protein [Xanthomonas hyacinthi]|uniref:helix-turn-helix domain-containing protein n=1 Tax=Xanthomonas hyacinthi TaxID=56455 RepID=UPI001FCAB3F6|nr:helix-turn-helix transcriptional regulator [Xanthomonas hyacinthi]